MDITTSTLKRFSIFSQLNDQDLFEILNKMIPKTCNKYDFIFMSDEPSNEVHFLVNGSIKIGNHSVEGKEIIKDIIHPFSTFGIMSVLGEKKRVNFAQALNKDVHYYSLSIQVFKHILSKNQTLSFQLLNIVGNKLWRTEKKLEALIFKDARSRIIDFIKEMAVTNGRRVGFELFFKNTLTQKEIANLTGTSRQTVTAVLNELKKENLITFNRTSILIRDFAKLS